MPAKHIQSVRRNIRRICRLQNRGIIRCIVALGIIIIFASCTTQPIAPVSPTVSPAQEHTIYYATQDEQAGISVNPLRSTISSLDVTNGRLRWQAHADDEIFYAPVVSNGLVFVVVVATVPNKSDTLQALDSASGKVRWIMRFPNRVYSLPSAGCDMIAIPLSITNRTFQFLGIDPTSGAVRWRYSGIPTGNFPTAQGNLLYFITGNQGSAEVDFDALNVCNGTIAWSQRMPATTGCDSSQVVTDGIIVVECVPLAAYQGRQPVTPTILAYNAMNGTLLWQGARGQPQIGLQGLKTSGGALYLVGNHSVQAYDIKTGHLLWQDQFTLPNIPLGFNIREVGKLALVAEPPGVVARDAITGKAQWQFTGEVDEWSFDESGGEVYLTDGAGTVTALALATGARLWQYHDQEPTARLGDPLIIGDILLLNRVLPVPGKGQQSSLITLRLKDGTIVWQFDTGELPAFPVLGP